MKKILAVLAMIAMFAMMFAGCSNGGQLGTCDLCGEENVNVRGITYEGETGYFCDGCYDTAQSLLELAQMAG